uniref:Putative PadR family transcriptional regulator n=1 Tax=Streptomyces tendae TaxID=1932 RepID=A7DWH9_STRTE|nr:putative PadR family transcriptional regulator [Streptomyces tendae]
MLHRRSTLALAVLSMLAEAEYQQEASMHPYRMQRLLRDRGKDEVVNVGQRGSLYRTIERLHRTGLIEVRESSRDGNRPERTLYSLTDEGRRVWREWMLDALATPTREYPEFPAAIAFIPLLDPGEVLGQLLKRRRKLTDEVARIQSLVTKSAEWGRLFVLELEYLRATTDAELHWVESVIDDMEAGNISWTPEQLAALASHRPL